VTSYKVRTSNVSIGEKDQKIDYVTEQNRQFMNPRTLVRNHYGTSTRVDDMKSKLSGSNFELGTD